MNNKKKIKDVNYFIRIFQDFLITWYIFMGIKLELFDYLKEKNGRTIEEIANDLNLRDKIVRDWCDSMLVEDLLIKEGNRYKLNKLTKRYLCRDSIEYIGFVITSLEYFTNAFQNFENNFKKNKKFFNYSPDQMLGITKNIAPIASFLTPIILSEVSDVKGPYNVLDIGCGLGYYLFNLADKIHDLKGIGVDIQPKILKEASKIAQIKGLNGRIEFKKRNALNLKLKDRYNIILMSNVVQAFDKNQNTKIFSNIYDLLAPNGKFIIIDCLLDQDIRNSKFNVFFNLYLKFESQYAQLYTLDQLKEMVLSTNLKFINHKHLGLGIDMIIFKKV